MGKVKRRYETEYRDPTEGYTGDLPRRGIYEGKLVDLSDHATDNSPNGLAWVFEITEEPYSGWRGWQYTNDDSTAWKEAQILLAIGIIGEGDIDKKGNIKVALNTTHEQIVKDAGPVRLQIRHETYEEEKRAKIGRVLPPDEGSKKAGGKKKGKKKKGSEDEPF